MADPKYRYVGSIEDRVIEECSELIQAITKANRFGLGNHHPRDPNKVTNRTHIRHEIDDVKRVLEEYLGYL